MYYFIDVEENTGPGGIGYLHLHYPQHEDELDIPEHPRGLAGDSGDEERIPLPKQCALES